MNTFKHKFKYVQFCRSCISFLRFILIVNSLFLGQLDCIGACLLKALLCQKNKTGDSRIVPVVFEPIGKVRPVYGELQSRDQLEEMAIRAQDHETRLWREREADCLLALEESLEKSQVKIVDVCKKNYLIDPLDMHIVLSRRVCRKPVRKVFWFDKHANKLYNYDSLIFAVGNTVHDLDLFQEIFKFKMHKVRAGLGPTPPVSPKPQGGLAQVTSCGHVFCRGCLTSWLQFKSSCANCLQDISDKPLIQANPEQISKAVRCTICLSNFKIVPINTELAGAGCDLE